MTMQEQTMKAIQVHQFGGPEVLQLDIIPRPQVKAGELLIKVYAAGVLPADTATRQGTFIPKTFPYIPGTAFSGVIEEVGEGVTNFRKGQAVAGRTAQGATAEYTIVHANPPAPNPNDTRAKQSAFIVPLALKPESLSFAEAAALSGGATTAWTSIFEDGGVQAGQRVLIHGGAGGVGLFAVQFAKWKGAHVTATTSTSNVEFVRSLGADVVVDYTTTAFEDVVQDLDFVLDTLGGEVQERSMHALKRGGTLVSVYQPPAPELAQQLGIRASMNATIPNSEHLKALIKVIDEGYAKPVIRKVFAMTEAAQAHALSEQGHGRGRIVIQIAE